MFCDLFGDFVFGVGEDGLVSIELLHVGEHEDVVYFSIWGERYLWMLM